MMEDDGFCWLVFFGGGFVFGVFGMGWSGRV